MIPGEVFPADEPIALNPGDEVTTVHVTNTGDRPVQVGSHYHFAAANPALEFDRAAAWGLHLDIPAGTAVRFEPGVDRDVDLVPLHGRRLVPGLRMEYRGALDERGPAPGPAPFGDPGEGFTATEPYAEHPEEKDPEETR